MYNALCYLQLYLKVYDSEIKYLKYRQNMKEMTALECENARSARSHILYSINVSVSSIYCRL